MRYKLGGLYLEGLIFGILRYFVFAVGCSFTTSRFIEFYIYLQDQEPIIRSEQYQVIHYKLIGKTGDLKTVFLML